MDQAQIVEKLQEIFSDVFDFDCSHIDEATTPKVFSFSNREPKNSISQWSEISTRE